MLRVVYVLAYKTQSQGRMGNYTILNPAHGHQGLLCHRQTRIHILNVKSTKCQSNVVVNSEPKKGINSPNNERTIGQNATRPIRTALPMGSGLETYEYSFGPSKNRLQLLTVIIPIVIVIIKN